MTFKEAVEFKKSIGNTTTREYEGGKLDFEVIIFPLGLDKESKNKYLNEIRLNEHSDEKARLLSNDFEVVGVKVLYGKVPVLIIPISS